MGATSVAVIGGGPAGLRAAEVAAEAGARVALFEGKPSVGRKLLVAGKGGLNLTHGEDFERFVTRYSAGPWRGLLEEFDAAALRQWAAGLGVETFQASSGRVYPRALKAAPLLRAWIARLRALGVEIHPNHRLATIHPGTPHRLSFTHSAEWQAEALVLATGGASWPRTGSDGGWVGMVAALGVNVHPLEPANCGWEHEWPPDVLASAEGLPIKNIQVRAGDHLAGGELMLTRYGLEGGALYQLGKTLREMPRPEIEIDFKPTFTEAQLVGKMQSVRRHFLDEATIRWKLSAPARAILGRKTWHDAEALAREAKSCTIPLLRPRPISEAISSAGGVDWRALDESLMLRDFPGIFIAGEMIDWEAPTGGYLLQGAFATGTRAGRAAAARTLP
jgi:uncharacterized flavoprotein (TIGR03862 family)